MWHVFSRRIFPTQGSVSRLPLLEVGLESLIFVTMMDNQEEVVVLVWILCWNLDGCE